MGAEEQRIERDREQRAGDDQAAALVGQQAERRRPGREDERELADLRQARRDRERRVQRVAQREHQQQRRSDLPTDDDRDDREHLQRRARPAPRGSNSMPTETKNSTAEGVAQRQRLLGGAVAERRLAQHHAGEERAERERDAEQRRRAVGDAHRRRDHAEREQFARAGLRDLPQQPGEARAARPTSMSATKTATCERASTSA